MKSAQTVSLKDIDKVFLVRSKIGTYATLDMESKMLLKEKYQKVSFEVLSVVFKYVKKNSRPTRNEFEEYSKDTNIPLDKVQNFFKYQRKIELKTGKLKSRFQKVNEKY